MIFRIQYLLASSVPTNRALSRTCFRASDRPEGLDPTPASYRNRLHVVPLSTRSSPMMKRGRLSAWHRRGRRGRRGDSGEGNA
jgi:hypothetical protein